MEVYLQFKRVAYRGRQAVSEQSILCHTSKAYADMLPKKWLSRLVVRSTFHPLIEQMRPARNSLTIIVIFFKARTGKGDYPKRLRSEPTIGNAIMT